MKIKLIAAVDQNMGIGKDNDLPWPRLKGDLQFFKDQTFQKPILMGRKTFESIGRPLPARTNLILSSRGSLHEEVLVFKDITQALLHAGSSGWETLFVIGGNSVYREFLPYCDEVILTEIESSFECDTFFPDFDKTKWDVEVLGLGEDNGHRYTHKKYTRK